MSWLCRAKHVIYKNVMKVILGGTGAISYCALICEENSTENFQVWCIRRVNDGVFQFRNVAKMLRTCTFCYSKQTHAINNK